MTFPPLVIHIVLHPRPALEILEAGIQALTRALELKKDDYWTLSGKSSLLREKAELTADQQERKALLDEAERLSEQASRLPTKPGPPNG